MSLQFLYGIGLIGILLSFSAYLGTKLKPRSSNRRIVQVARFASYGAMAVLYLLMVAPAMGSPDRAASRLQYTADRVWFSVSSYVDRVLDLF